MNWPGCGCYRLLRSTQKWGHIWCFGVCWTKTRDSCRLGLPSKRLVQLHWINMLPITISAFELWKISVKLVSVNGHTYGAYSMSFVILVVKGKRLNSFVSIAPKFLTVKKWCFYVLIIDFVKYKNDAFSQIDRWQLKTRVVLFCDVIEL